MFDSLEFQSLGWFRYGCTYPVPRAPLLYDSRKLSFSGLAGEVVLPERKGRTVRQLARTPYICGFRAGWTKFAICTVHIYYGQNRPDDPRRIEEIRNISSLLAARVGIGRGQPDSADGSSNPAPENLILLGDFNIFERGSDKTFRVLAESGFIVPQEIRVLKTNARRDKEYDQIAFLKRNNRFESTGKAGVFDFYKCVFGEDAKTIYQVPTRTNFAQWRTYQMSDHFLLWTELRIDFSNEYLRAAFTCQSAQRAGSSGTC